jgi:hypothetical protein
MEWVRVRENKKPFIHFRDEEFLRGTTQFANPSPVSWSTIDHFIQDNG